MVKLPRFFGKQRLIIINLQFRHMYISKYCKDGGAGETLQLRTLNGAF